MFSTFIQLYRGGLKKLSIPPSLLHIFYTLIGLCRRIGVNKIDLHIILSYRREYVGAISVPQKPFCLISDQSFW